MKKVLLVLLAVILLVSMCACSKKPDNVSDPQKSDAAAEAVAMRERCWATVTECKVVEQEDGTAAVTLSGPDYPALLQYLADNGVTGNVTIDMLDDAAAQNPTAVKEYSFVAASVDEDKVQEALMEQVAFDLMAVAFDGMVG